jgi:hypothetical protein
MDKVESAGILLACILSAGVLGGFTGCFLLKATTAADSESAEDGKLSLGQHIVIGIAAAALAPLFLSLAKSSLVTDIVANKNVVEDSLIFFGISLLAATSARRFMNNSTKKVLDQLERHRSEIVATKEKTERLEEACENAKHEPAPDAKMGGISHDLSSYPPDEKRVLDVLLNGNLQKRTIEGITRDTKLPPSRIEGALKKLVKETKVVEEKGPVTGRILYRADHSALKAS